MNSIITKRSIAIRGHKTSVSLEEAFWQELRVIAAARRQTLTALIAEIDAGREHANLSSALRLFVLHYYRNAA